MKKRTNILLAGVVVGLMATQAHGEMIFTIQEVGNDVTAVGSGSVNLTELSFGGGSFALAGVRGRTTLLGVGVASLDLTIYHGLTGPSQIGTGLGVTLATTSSGDNFLITNTNISVPEGYISGTQLDGSATFSNTTIANLGLTEGSYTYTWGSGASADSATVIIGAIPEPSVIALTTLLSGGLFAVRRIFMI